MTTADPYLERIEKKIGKLTARLFHVPPEQRTSLLEQIQKLKTRHKNHQLNKARVRVPDELFTHRVKYTL